MVRGSISFVIVGIVLLAGVALVALPNERVQAMLPAKVQDALAGLGASSGLGSGGGSRIKATTPQEALVDGPEGLWAEGPVAALSGNAPVFISDVITGYSTAVARDIPAEITTIRPIMGCLLTPPLPGSRVGHVTAGASDLPLALSTYGDAELAAAVQALVDRYRDAGEAVAEVPPGLAYQAYDVAVTETRGPVYLVLETSGGNRIWNIHLAPGARVERVVLLGGAQVGVANLDPVVPVEVLQDQGLADCGIRPAHPLNPGHRLLTADAGGTLSPGETAARRSAHEAAVAAYGQWFRDSFGTDASGRAGFANGTIAVVGPVPGAEEPKAVYAPIQGAKIRTTHDRQFEIAGQVPEGADFAARVLAIATAFAEGDLATLRQGADF
jgi:hypothetical protein